MSAPLVYTPASEINLIREELRTSFNAGKAKSIAFRKEQLLNLAYMFQDNAVQFQEALSKDLGRPILESNMSDLSPIIGEALLAYKNVDSWAKSEKAPFDSTFFVFSPKITKEPKGTVLIISPFNYPFWCMGPLAGAIAAGCAVVTKPSELTPATSQLLAELFPKYMDQGLYRIVNGAIDETTQLLSMQWDHIVYTGSGRVGRIVATAAAKHITPVTLELGGKSPVFVDSNTDFDLAARRILWGKMMNSGQSCTAPDYILVPAHAQAKLVEALKKQYKNFYGNDAHTSDSFSRICSPAHWERISGLLAETNGDIVLGGETIREEKYIAPTVVQNVSFDDSLMKEEIFGPILPIVPVTSIDAGIQYVNSHDHPLALYIFSKDAKLRASVKDRTMSGMVMENGVVLQCGSSVTPFGGVGASGYGAHRGKYSYDTFTHHRPIFHSPKWLDLILGFRYPPYTAKKLKAVTTQLMSPIPYPRPGTSAPISWKKWLTFAVVFGALAMDRQRIAGLFGALGMKLPEIWRDLRLR